MIEMEAFIVSVTEVALLNAHSQTKMKTGIQTDLLPLLFNGHVFLWILLHHLKSKTEKFRFLQNAASTFSFLDVYVFHWAFHCLALFTIQTISNSASGLQLIWLPSLDEALKIHISTILEIRETKFENVKVPLTSKDETTELNKYKKPTDLGHRQLKVLLRNMHSSLSQGVHSGLCAHPLK